MAILTHNEEKNIERCLRSVIWAGEILVIDDCSGDQTAALVSRFSRENRHCHLLTRKLNGDFAAQRNFALSKTAGDWILFLDADEEVTPELAAEIQQTLAGTPCVGYFIKRSDSFRQRMLRHGETGRVKLLRLGRKEAGFWRRKVHEFWDIKGKTGELKTPLMHYPHPTVRDFLDSVNYYSGIDAGELAKEGKSFRYWRVVINPLGKFLQNYLLKRGLLDGEAGLVMAWLMSFQSLVVRVKMYEQNL